MTEGAREQTDGQTIERFPAVPSCAGRIRARCRARAAELGASRETVHAVAVAVTEAAANAVLHAYAGTSPGHVVLELSGGSGRLEVVIRDTGSGLGHATSRGGLGQGLLLIEQLTDTLEVTSERNRGTTVRMCFRLP